MTGHLLSPEQRLQVEKLLSESLPDGVQRRARILLLYDDGQPTHLVAQAAGRSRGRTRFWRRQFLNRGMAIFPVPDQAQVAPFAKEGTSMTLSSEPAQNDQALSETPGGSQPAAESQPILVVASPAAGPPEPPLALQEQAAATPGSTETTATQELLSLLRGLKSPGVSPDDPLVEAGRKVLRFHFAEMLRHEAGTRLGEDIEELHDMRVATRRMRAGFEIFETAFKPKALKKHLKGLRATGRALGRVRDLDVFMEKARRYQEGLPEEGRQGLAPLLDLWEGERATARDRLVEYLDDPDYETFKRRFYTFVSTPGAGVPAPDQGQAVPTLVRETAPVLIYTRLGSVRAFTTILSNASLEQFHMLRIEFKKLRYTLEFFREVLGDEIKQAINDLKGLQDHLGDLNDAQVATQILSQFLADWDQRQAGLPIGERQNPGPVVAYLAYQHAERHRLMTTFGEAWSCFDRPEFRRNLALAVSAL